MYTVQHAHGTTSQAHYNNCNNGLYASPRQYVAAVDDVLPMLFSSFSFPVVKMPLCRPVSIYMLSIVFTSTVYAA